MANTETTVSNLKINRLTQTQLENASSLSNTEAYWVDPQFTGGKVLATDSKGDIVETTVAPADIGTVKTVNNTSPDSNGNVAITIPSEVTETTVSNWGFTKNTGTVTSVNNVSPVSGNVTLSIPTQASDIGAVATTDCAQIYPVIDTYVSGTSWYRIYSDGWCEMGGIFATSSTVNSFDTVYFLKTFNDTNYFIVGSYISSSAQEYAFSITDKTDASAKISHNNASRNMQWFACGYLASGQYTSGTYKAYKP